MSDRGRYIGWVLAVGALLPGHAWAQESPAELLSLPLVSLQEQGAPVAFDCRAAQDAQVMLRSPEQTLPAACAGAPLGFSASGSRLGWFGALGKLRYLLALPAGLGAAGLGGGGGGGGGGTPHDDAGNHEIGGGGGSSERRPYSNPVPEPAATALFTTGALLVAGAVRRQRRRSS
jgi:hypothetical protein